MYNAFNKSPVGSNLSCFLQKTKGPLRLRIVWLLDTAIERVSLFFLRYDIFLIQIYCFCFILIFSLSLVSGYCCVCFSYPEAFCFIQFFLIIVFYFFRLRLRNLLQQPSLERSDIILLTSEVEVCILCSCGFGLVICSCCLSAFINWV